MNYLVFIFVTLISAPLLAQLNFELGGVYQDRNDFRIAPDTGTKVDLKQFGKGPFEHYRIEYHQNIVGPHGIRVIYAPFRVKFSGTLNDNVQFNGESFSQGTTTEAIYQFNSYRVGYTYDYSTNGPRKIRLGFTGKIRDAVISLKQGSTESAYDNVGFVPLFYFSYENKLSDNWKFYSDLDASAAPQGRAFDLAIKLRRNFKNNSHLGIGYRTIEGGADNDKVYSFSWFNYGVIEYGISF